MKKIAIFVSGEGKAAERIVKLFNEGNRLRTVLVVTDDSARELDDHLKNEDVKVIHIPDSEWHQRSAEVAELLRQNEVNLLVSDNFDLSLSDEIMESTSGEFLKVSSPEQAPREVVAALEANLRNPVVEEEEETKEEPEEGNPSPESEWADTLKINFRPPKIPTTPPEVPQSEKRQPWEAPSPISEEQPATVIIQEDHRHKHHREEMPSTWLIWSVLVTVFCCFIPGIIAIIFSSQVSSRYYAGDFEGARRASRNAEIWIIVSFVLGVITATLYLPFMLLG